MSFVAVAIGGGALIGGLSSIFAGQTQASAANNAAGLQYSLGEQSLAQNQQQYNQNQQNLAPWLQQGKASLSQLGGLTSTPGQGLLAGFNQQFSAPTAAQAAATPGYQFALGQGENAIQNSAAARGGLVSGNAATSLNNYAQGAADTNYQQVYNNAMQQYLNSYNIFNSNQTNEYNRLAGLAGTGQTAATTLGQQGQQAANTAAGINATIGSQVGQNINNAGAATASGYVGAGNAASGGLNNLAGLALLNGLGGTQGITSQDFAAANGGSAIGA
jgi:hypothetical protein